MSQLSQLTSPAEWLGYFYGHDLEFLRAEQLAIQHIPASILKNEAALMKVKWFDYRRMHPTKSTYLFAHQYSKAYSNAICVMKDGESGKYMKGFKGMDFMASREKLSFWRLRQHIDSLGIRYDFFLRHAMNHCISNGWLQPPRPSHIKSDDELNVAVLLAWEEECKAKIQFCQDTRYKVASFFGHADQIAYEQYIIDQIKTRQNPHYSLHASLYIEQVVRIEEVLRQFDARVIDRALAISVSQ